MQGAARAVSCGGRRGRVQPPSPPQQQPSSLARAFRPQRARAPGHTHAHARCRVPSAARQRGRCAPWR